MTLLKPRKNASQRLYSILPLHLRIQFSTIHLGYSVKVIVILVTHPHVYGYTLSGVDVIIFTRSHQGYWFYGFFLRENYSSCKYIIGCFLSPISLCYTVYVYFIILDCYIQLNYFTPNYYVLHNASLCHRIRMNPQCTVHNMATHKICTHSFTFVWFLHHNFDIKTAKSVGETGASWPPFSLCVPQTPCLKVELLNIINKFLALATYSLNFGNLDPSVLSGLKNKGITTNGAN